MTSLREIIHSTQQQLVQKQREVSLEELQRRVAKTRSQRRPFLESIQSTAGLAVIAEIKTASPSTGQIAETIDVSEVARAYAAGGAAAISVLTEPVFFKGALERIAEVKAEVNLPVLRKDFIIDAYQVYESKVYGADAILLVARLLTSKQLCEFYELARSLQLDVLVEIHSPEELERALQCKPSIIGVNARNLDTMRIDPKVFSELIPRVPKSITVVAESGIGQSIAAADVQTLGAKAVLVGTSLMRAADKTAAVRRLRLPAAAQPLIKICGITNEADAMYAAQSGADYLGFILNYPVSPRYIMLSEAKKIIQRVRQLFPNTRVAGVFVDASAELVCQIAADAKLDVVQLHGSESPAVVQDVVAQAHAAGITVFKTVELHDTYDLSAIPNHDAAADLILLDAGKGSGKRIQTALLNAVHTATPLGLAGGLHPDNVQELILRYAPALVDVNSGVESVPGKKDPVKLKQFINAVRTISQSAPAMNI